MSLDVNNPWEAHAYFALGFWCEACETCFEFHSPHKECSDEWFVAIARAAFDGGWFVPHPLRDGRMDCMTAYCPRCGRDRGFTQPTYETTNAAS